MKLDGAHSEDHPDNHLEKGIAFQPGIRTDRVIMLFEPRSLGQFVVTL